MELDCRSCSDGQKIDRGCVKDSPIPDRWQIEDWKFRKCPLKMITKQSVRYIEAYKMYDKGYLPNAGGWLDQGAKFISAMNVIERELNKTESK